MLLADEAVSTGALILEFANSPLGVTLVGAIVAFILAKVWKAKPGWQKVFDEHKGLLFDAVRHAEEAIPDGTAGAGQKVDLALQYLLRLESPVSKKKKADLREALSKAHTTLEEKKDVKFRRAIETKRHGVEFGV